MIMMMLCDVCEHAEILACSKAVIYGRTWEPSFAIYQGPFARTLKFPLTTRRRPPITRS